MHTLLLPNYCSLSPSAQNAIDIFKDQWLTAFPTELGVHAGSLPVFEVDTRVSWVNSIYPLEGKTVLELGPYEAYNTVQLQQFGATQITAIEGNDISYLKCLIVKEIMKIDGNFLYGDFIKFLEEKNDVFDIIWASGILYHLSDPILALDLICRHTDAIFLWTHYWSIALSDNSNPDAQFFVPEHDIVRSLKGFDATYHFRHYKYSKTAGFSGGKDDYSYWMEREEIIAFLKRSGFNNIKFGIDNPAHPAGPAMFLLAKREAPSSVS